MTERTENRMTFSGLAGTVHRFGRMIKFSHSLFALPFAAVSAIVAVNIAEVTIKLVDVALLLLCMISARTAAMGFNRIVDRKIDAKNPRTDSRELPSGTISIRDAWLFTSVAAVAFVLGSFGLNMLSGVLSTPLLLLLFGYSVTKRVTWASHFVLGACLGAAPIGVWFALTGTFDWAPVLLGSGVMLWTAGFDVYYSLQDEEFDRSNGLHSIPERFGKIPSLILVRLIHFAAIVAFGYFGVVSNLGPLFWVGLGGVVSILLYEAWILRSGDLARIDMAFFTLNGYVSILFAIAVAIDLVLRGEFGGSLL